MRKRTRQHACAFWLGLLALPVLAQSVDQAAQPAVAPDPIIAPDAVPATVVVEANLPFGNADGGVQGLLGSDMLSAFDVVTIDYAHERLRLHHRA